MTYNVVFLAIIVLFLFSELAFKGRKRKKAFLVSSFLLLAVLSGVRYQNEASDFMTNYMHVVNVAKMSWKEVILYSSELLHPIIRKIVAIIFKDPQWYFILTAFFIVGAHIKCANKYAINYVLFVLMYYGVFSYFTTNNLTRQGIAVAITLFAWDALLKRDVKAFFVLIVAASLIHVSSVLFAALFFLSEWKVTKKTIYAYVVLGGVILIFSDPIIKFGQLFLYSNYTESSYGMTAANPMRLVMAILVAIALYFYTMLWNDEKECKYIQASELEERKHYTTRFKNFISHGSFIYILCIILSSTKILLFSRVAMYFSPCAMICMDRALMTFKPKTRLWIKTVLVIFITLWFLAFNLTGKLTPTPYTPFWLFPDRALIQ